MAFTFSDLKSEVKRRATKNQGGTQFDTGIENTINTSLWRIAREACWRSLRRETSFDTVAKYNTGTGAVALTNNSKNVTVTGATFLTDDVKVKRYTKFSNSSKFFKIATITGETTFTLDQVCDGTTTSTGTYSILGQEEYVLPIQVGHSCLLWHRGYGYPITLKYIPTMSFFDSTPIDTMENIPTHYRMWGMNTNVEELLAPSVISVSSSSTADTSKSITVFGVVSGYPDYEIINTNASDGTIAVNGTKTFSSVERIVRSQETTGRITCTANSGNATIAVLPVGKTTTGPLYTKIQLYPLPNQVFPINVLYYKLPYQLVNGGDVPEIGEEFSEAIILLSTAKMKGEQNQKEMKMFYDMYRDEINSLKKTNVDKLDWKPNLQRPYPSGNIIRGDVYPQQIGSMYGWK